MCVCVLACVCACLRVCACVCICTCIYAVLLHSELASCEVYPRLIMIACPPPGSLSGCQREGTTL